MLFTVKAALVVGALALAPSSTLAPATIHDSGSDCGEYLNSGSVVYVPTSNGTTVGFICGGAACCVPETGNSKLHGDYLYCACPNGAEQVCCHAIAIKVLHKDGTITYREGAKGDCETTECPNDGECGTRGLAPQSGASAEFSADCYPIPQQQVEIGGLAGESQVGGAQD